MAGLAGSLTARFEALSAWSKAASPLLRSHVISECLEQPYIGGRDHSRTSRPPFSDTKRPPFIAEGHTFTGCQFPCGRIASWKLQQFSS